jgi:hypothetical protein
MITKWIEAKSGCDCCGRRIEIGDILYDPNCNHFLYVVAGYTSFGSVRVLWSGGACNEPPADLETLYKNSSYIKIDGDNSHRCTIIPIEAVRPEKQKEILELRDLIKRLHEQDNS